MAPETTPSYTAELAYDPARRRARTAVKFGLLPPTPLVDRYLLGPFSSVTWIAVDAVVAGGFVCLIPSIAFSKYVMRWPSMFNLPREESADGRDVNASNGAMGSTTAVKTLSVRSQLYLQGGGGPDWVAPLIMRQLSLFGPNIPGSVLLTRLWNMLFRWHFRLTGRIFADQMAEVLFSKKMKFGECGILQPRTCWLDDVVDTFARKEDGRQFNVVFLGAGFDTRSYRLESILTNEDANLYEVDAAGTQSNKRRTLNNARIDSSHVQFVDCDFEREDWLECLQTKSDFDRSLATAFVWEGVMMYLDIEVAMATISKVRKCGKGSCIAFDYFDASCLTDWMKKSTSKIGEPMKSAIDNLDEFVVNCNRQSSEGLQLSVWDHLRCDELKKRYIAQVGDRHIGYLSEFGGFLLLGTQ